MGFPRPAKASVAMNSVPLAGCKSTSWKMNHSQVLHEEMLVPSLFAFILEPNGHINLVLKRPQRRTPVKNKGRHWMPRRSRKGLGGSSLRSGPGDRAWRSSSVCWKPTKVSSWAENCFLFVLHKSAFSRQFTPGATHFPQRYKSSARAFFFLNPANQSCYLIPKRQAGK